MTYTLFANNACTEPTTIASETVILNPDGTVPNSLVVGPLAAGSYSFQAVYSGDANYTGSTGSCEPFAVARRGQGTATVVFDAATGAAWGGTKTTGASAFDTATVNGVGGLTPTGTVTSRFSPTTSAPELAPRRGRSL